MYIQAQAPKYPLGFGMGPASNCGAVIMARVLRRAFRRENRRRDEVRGNFTDQEHLDMGDRSPFVRYTL